MLGIFATIYRVPNVVSDLWRIVNSTGEIVREGVR